MSLIEVTLGGKGVGLADQASIEPAKGCTNGCVGCYAAKTTRMGRKFFDEVLPKEYDDNVFRKSCSRVRNKGIKVVRMAKHCDPGHPSLRRRVIQILQATKDEDLQVVFVTKSLEFDPEVARGLIAGNHTLHVSLGMKIMEGGTAPSDSMRYRAFRQYERVGVKAYARVIDDVTSEKAARRWLGRSNLIVTPMRFASKNDLLAYGADPDKFAWRDGYYKPTEMHPDWGISDKWCGYIGDNELCCNCGVNNDLQETS